MAFNQLLRQGRSTVLAAILLALLFISGLQLNAQSCASIHVYRPNVFSNSLVLLGIYVDNVKLADIRNNGALTIDVPAAGTYKVSAKWGIRGETYRMRTVTEVQVACGQDEYVKVKSGALDAKALLTRIHGGEGAAEMAIIPTENVIRLLLDGASSTIQTAQTPPPTQPQPALTRNQEPATPPPSQPPAKVATKGVSYALIIGVNEYQDPGMNDLDQPINDAQKLHDVLLSQYTFDPEHMTFLKNPTGNEITRVLESFYKKLTPEDNLLIFYAGHGYWDEKFQQGYWLAADANRNNRGTWLSNGTVRDYIRAIPSRHTLLVTDACFGGGIFKSRAAFANSSTAINQLYKLPSRKAITSGAMSEVPDKSVFIEYLVKRLQQNTEQYLSAEQLFASFKIAVINNSANGQVPQFGEIRETGDEGGDYIFIRK